METLRDEKTATSQISSYIDAEAESLLSVTGLRKAFGGHVVLDGVSLEARRGEVVLLRGNNGSGKTTLLNILTGNLEPDAGTIQLSTDGVQKAFRFPKSWWQSLNPLLHFSPERITQKGVGRTWQDIRLFPTLNLRDNIAVATPHQVGENPAWAILRRPIVRCQEKANSEGSETMLASLGLKGREASSADKVSLGQSKRVAIARAVRAGARILFLDEPPAGLDTAGVAEVMNLLEELAHDKEVTLVIVEHIFNIPRILDLATKVWTLEHGKMTVETPAEVRAELEHTTSEGIRGWIGEMFGSSSKIVDQKLPGGAMLSTVTPLGANVDAVVLEVENVVVHHGRRLVPLQALILG